LEEKIPKVELPNLDSGLGGRPQVQLLCVTLAPIIYQWTMMSTGTSTGVASSEAYLALAFSQGQGQQHALYMRDHGYFSVAIPITCKSPLGAMRPRLANFWFAVDVLRLAARQNFG
jgi:hypothetical protein